jgi:hypothetical protein
MVLLPYLSTAVSRTGIGLTVAVLACTTARAAEFDDPARAESQPAAKSLHFVNDVLPVLTRYGCNSGGCHGRAVGQNGFKLSLFGFDPAADFAAIAEDGLARRVSWTAPEESLLLRKASGQVPHGGGVRFDPASSPYRLLSQWIAEGTPWGDENAPTLTAIEVEPAERTAAGGTTGRLRVIARFSDGSHREVTEITEFFNQSPAQLAVSPLGEVRVLETPGEGTIAVRYQGVVTISRWIVPYRSDPPAEFYAGFAPINFVDQLVLDRWRRLGLAPSPPATDTEFLRRAFLDVIGTLPAPQEIREFLADSTPDKRERLIDRLLERPEYATFWAQKWGDILRNRQGDAAQKDNSLKFNEWLRASLAANMPFDQFARALIAVTGKIEEQPQMDWYRQLNSPQNRVEDICQVFLGMRVSCANCHNHPFERISQDDYWRFAAFFARVDAMSYGTVKTVAVKDEGAIVNPRTGQEMTPRTFGGPEVPFVKGEDARQKLVDWLTAKENPYFARTLVNRLWGHYLKRGLVEPVDDQRATNPATNPALLDVLAKDFADSGYDVKRLTRTILRSRVYGLSSAPRPENAADRQNFARHYPQRLAPHVLLDAIDMATGHTTKFQQFADLTRAIQLPNEFEQNDFLDIFGRSKRDTPCVCETRLEPNLSQVLFLLFSPEVQQALSHPEGQVAQWVKSNKPTPEVVDELYLRTVSRLPAERDRQEAAALIDGAMNRQAAVEDLLWTLLNSKEFLLNH